jgi:hypothetical protein
MHPEDNLVIPSHAPVFTGAIDCNEVEFKKYSQQLIDINGSTSISFFFPHIFHPQIISFFLYK